MFHMLGRFVLPRLFLGDRVPVYRPVKLGVDLVFVRTAR